MKKLISMLLVLCLLAAYILVPGEILAASEYYASYSDVDKISDYGSCTVMQGLAVGSAKLYSVKIKSDNTQAFLSMTDRETKETVKMTNADDGGYYFDYLGHANDMDVTSYDGKSHLFIATMTKGSNAVVRLKRSGTSITKFAGYSLSYNGSSISCSGIAIKSNSNGVITLICKSGNNVYTGTVDASATSGTIELSLLCMISKSKVYIKDQYYDLSSYTNQGMGYHEGVMYVPISGSSGNLNRSVIMVFNLDNVIPGSTIYPTDAISFRVTSSSYAKQFEIESCGICSADGQLYFNTNRVKENGEGNHDGVSVFKDYTFVKLTEPAVYQNFVVQYDANGGTGTMSDSVIPYGVSTKLSANTYTRAGYKFAGWTAYRTAQDQWYYTDGTEKGWYAAGSQPSGYTNYIYKDKQSVSKISSVNEDKVILYAQWTPNTYTVRYDPNGGTGTMADTTVTYGTNSALRKNTFVREGYTFVGWTAYRTAQNQWRYSNPSGTGSGWYKEGSQPEGYTLLVYGDGVNVAKTSSVDNDVTVFYAQWAPISYTVTFQNEDGSVLQSTQVSFDTVPTPPENPTKMQNGCTVYTFAGWDKEIVAVSGDTTYTATYSEGILHSWSNGTCTGCGQICPHASHSIDGICSLCGGSVNHSYKTVTKDATCTADGSQTHNCIICGYSYTETVPMIGHSYTTVTTEATCTTDGYTTHTCSKCSDSYTDSRTPATGHTEVTVAGKAATCTEPGLTEGKKCTACGTVTVEQTEVSATGHSYVDGKCTNCGEADPSTPSVVVPNVVMDYPTLSFEGEVMYNLYYNVDDMTSVVEMGLITFAERLYEGTMADAVKVYPGYSGADGSYMSQTAGIPAKELGDTVFFKVYAKLSDGSYVYSEVVGYHAMAYAKSILKNSSNEHMKRLVIAMINYGAEAQKFFNYNTDSLMNSFLTAEQQAMISAYDASMIAPLASVDSAKVGMFTYNQGDFARRYNSVSFDGAFSINYYFTAKGEPDNGMKFYYWNLADYNAATVLTPENATGTMDMVEGENYQFWGQVPNIAAKQVDETVFVAGVYELDGVTYTTGILAYSLGKYCQKIAADDTSDQQAFSAATAVYGYYAKEYFANL